MVEGNNRWNRNFNKTSGLVGGSRITPEMFNCSIASDGFPGLQAGSRLALLDSHGACVIHEPATSDLKFTYVPTYSCSFGDGYIHTYDDDGIPCMVYVEESGPFTIPSSSHCVVASNDGSVSVKLLANLFISDVILALRSTNGASCILAFQHANNSHAISLTRLNIAGSLEVGDKTTVNGDVTMRYGNLLMTGGGNITGVNKISFYTGVDNYPILYYTASGQPVLYGARTSGSGASYMDFYPSGGDPNGYPTKGMLRLACNASGAGNLQLEMDPPTGKYSTISMRNIYSEIYVTNSTELALAIASVTTGGVIIHCFPGTYTTVTINNASGDFHIIGYGAATKFSPDISTSGISIIACRSVVVENCYFYMADSVSYGININPSGSPGNMEVTIRDCKFEGGTTQNASYGVKSLNCALVVQNCMFTKLGKALYSSGNFSRITDNLFTSCQGNDGDTTIMLNIGSDSFVSNNIIYYCLAGNGVGSHITGIQLDGSYNVINDNVILLISGSAATGDLTRGILVDGSYNSITGNNVSLTAVGYNRIGISTMLTSRKGNVISGNNVVVGTGIYGIACGESNSVNGNVVNGTIITTDNYCIVIGNRCTTLTISGTGTIGNNTTNVVAAF